MQVEKEDKSVSSILMMTNVLFAPIMQKSSLLLISRSVRNSNYEDIGTTSKLVSQRIFKAAIISRLFIFSARLFSIFRL